MNMNFNIRPLPQRFNNILNTITIDLADPAGPGESARTYDNNEVYQAAYVERIGEDRYSVAHYYTENGDRIADPDIEFIKHDGKWYPAACQQRTGWTCSEPRLVQRTLSAAARLCARRSTTRRTLRRRYTEPRTSWWV